MTCIVVLFAMTVLGRVGCLMLTSVGNGRVENYTRVGYLFACVLHPFVLELRD